MPKETHLAPLRVLLPVLDASSVPEADKWSYASQILLELVSGKEESYSWQDLKKALGHTVNSNRYGRFQTDHEVCRGEWGTQLLLRALDKVKLESWAEEHEFKVLLRQLTQCTLRAIADSDASYTIPKEKSAYEMTPPLPKRKSKKKPEPVQLANLQQQIASLDRELEDGRKRKVQDDEKAESDQVASLKRQIGSLEVVSSTLKRQIENIERTRENARKRERERELEGLEAEARETVVVKGQEKKVEGKKAGSSKQAIKREREGSPVKKIKKEREASPVRRIKLEVDDTAEQELPRKKAKKMRAEEIKVKVEE